MKIKKAEKQLRVFFKNCGWDVSIQEDGSMLTAEGTFCLSLKGNEKIFNFSILVNDLGMHIYIFIDKLIWSEEIARLLNEYNLQLTSFKAYCSDANRLLFMDHSCCIDDENVLIEFVNQSLVYFCGEPHLQLLEPLLEQIQDKSEG